MVSECRAEELAEGALRPAEEELAGGGGEAVAEGEEAEAAEEIEGDEESEEAETDAEAPVRTGVVVGGICASAIEDQTPSTASGWAKRIPMRILDTRTGGRLSPFSVGTEKCSIFMNSIDGMSSFLRS